jgi:hypothetical protein
LAKFRPIKYGMLVIMIKFGLKTFIVVRPYVVKGADRRGGT